MKAAPFLISWHNDNAPIYSVHFEPHGKGRLATSGGDNNVRLWRMVNEGDERRITYISTLIKHTQAVNVVRFAPRGELLATAGDDGNTLLWVPSETHTQAFGEDGSEDKETWRVKHMCRSFGSEIYDLAWSPDAAFFITGSMDNIARIYNASTGQMVRQIAEHNHYVQGVAWDPLNEFVATQSSDRSVHIYNLKTKDGEFTLKQHNKITKMELPNRRISASSPAPPDIGQRQHVASESGNVPPGSPAPGPSVPGTPNSMALPMNPPSIITHSRRSSIGSQPSMRRSVSPAPSMPLPAVRPMENSPVPFSGLNFKTSTIYANETYTSFFRRLTFTPEGSLLFTPAGQYRTPNPSSFDGTKNVDDVVNTVYIYTRAGFNKPPIAHLPGHKKPSIAVKCSPIVYTLRSGLRPTKAIAIDTSSADGAIPALPDPMVSSSSIASSIERPPSRAMDPPPTSNATMPSPKEISRPTSSPRDSENDGLGSSAFVLPYRIVYAVATQDSVLVYDTQQQLPLCIVSNLHFATFTDLSWSNDGLTLVISSSDGFCSNLAFSPGELGQVYAGSIPTASHPHPQSLTVGTHTSVHNSPVATPTAPAPPTLQKMPSSISTSFASPAHFGVSNSPIKSRSNSVSSVATQSSHVQSQTLLANSPTPIIGTVPAVTASTSSSALPLSTPPMTPMSVMSATSSMPGTNTAAGNGNGTTTPLIKRDSTSVVESDQEEQKKVKKRRIAPTPVPGPSSSGTS